ncbi:hypothetical protein, partial [Agromyces humi]|uniref:hypothetical protein n=1 Tax=Agromyces humi TaxID=1766800 RepID=UPI00135CB864
DQPVIVIPYTALLIVVIGLAVLAAADVATHRVEWLPTMLLGAAAASALWYDGITVQQWIWAILTAAAVFLFYLEMGVLGRFGGGDITLAPIPALVIGAVNPILGIWVFTVAIALQGVVSLAVRIGLKDPQPTLPHVPAMFAGVAAPILFGIL